MKSTISKQPRKSEMTSPRITKREGLQLLKKADLLGLGMMADGMRKKLHPEGRVSFIIDRNINYTNVCINQCRFCAFYRDIDSRDAYVLSRRALYKKIRETIECGGTQILMQGGLHPELGLDYYVGLLKAIRKNFDIHIHALSPPEISYIAKGARLSVRDTLLALQEAGLDSIPGGGAEILSDRVRAQVSPRKIKSSEWLMVMEEAHKVGMRTTATMMFGSVEDPEDVIEHLDVLRKLQDRTGGFTAFIPWSFQPGNTELNQRSAVSGQRSGEQKSRRADGTNKKTSELPNFRTSGFFPAAAVDYLRILAVSRIYLDNFPNVQASWVTQGLKVAQVALRFGANDFGSTMLEENVVAAAGVRFETTIDEIVAAIRNAGFRPVQRDMYYRTLKERF